MFRETVTRVEWEHGAGSFCFERVQGSSGLARLIMPSGAVVELSDAQWEALATAVIKVVSHGKNLHRRNIANAPSASPNAGQPWTAGEDAHLKQRWNAGESARSLSVHFGRSVGAIAARLVKLGLIDDRAEARIRVESGVVTPSSVAVRCEGV